MDSMAQYEGTVTPSFLQRQIEGPRQEDFFRKLPMRLGRIVKVHAPKDATNRSRKFYEYDVLVDAGSEHQGGTRYTIYNCLLISNYGSAADFSRHTLRQLQSDKQDVKDYGFGSHVLVLCINASAFGGVIIGGVQHAGSEGDDPDKGHHSIQQFNGIRQEIDKDGQLHVTFSGATKEDGKLESFADANASGSGYHLLKDGSFKWHTRDDEQYIFVDHKSKLVDVHARDSLKLVSEGTFDWEAYSDMTLSVGGNRSTTISGDDDLKSGGNITQYVKGNWYVTSETGELNLRSPSMITLTSTGNNIYMEAPMGIVATDSLGVHLGSATDSMIKGTTYRAAETTLHTSLAAQMQALMGALTSLAALLTTAGVQLNLATVFHKIPVAGPILGSIPLQAGALAVNAAAASATAAATAAQAMAAAITTFESSSPTYLSMKNFLD